jgi:hypothetical protein
MLPTVFPVLELHPQSPAVPKLKSDSAKITFEDIRTISKSNEANREVKTRFPFTKNIIQGSGTGCL